MDITLAGGLLTYHPNDDQLGRVSIELAAFDGEIGNGQIPIPDPVAALSVASGRQALIEEGATLLSDGFVLDQDRVRGPVPAGAAGEYVFGIQDANALLGGFRVTRSRPSETDYARVMAFAAADLPSVDTTMVINASTYTLPAKDYDGDGGWAELITDLIEFTGKTLFLHDKADGSGRCLHYHVLSGGHTCGLAISDVPADQDATTFYPWDPQRTRTAVDLVNDIKGRDQDGRTKLLSDATSITAHDADGLQHQALVDFEASSQADLDAKTAAYLANQKDERDTFTCSIGPLDETALALIRVGDRITVTSSVMGLTASVKRISHITLTVLTGEGGRTAPGRWMAALEMDAPVRRRSRVKPSLKGVVISPDVKGGDGLDGGDCACPPWVCEPNDFNVDSVGGGPVTVILCSGSYNGTQSSFTNTWSVPPYSCHIGPAYMTLYVGATYRVEYHFFWLPDPYGHLIGLGMIASGGPEELHVPMGNRVEHPEALLTYYDNGAWTVPGTPGTSGDWGLLVTFAGYLPDAAGSIASVTVTYLSGPDPRFTDVPRCANGVPPAGNKVTEGGTIGTTSGTTAYPYQPASLGVTVGGVAVTPTEIDPEAGTYTLPFAPTVEPVVTYQATGGEWTGADHGPPVPALQYVPDAVLATGTPIAGDVPTWQVDGTRAWAPAGGSTRWEIVMEAGATSPPVPVWTVAGDDYVYAEVPI